MICYIILHYIILIFELILLITGLVETKMHAFKPLHNTLFLFSMVILFYLQFLYYFKHLNFKLLYYREKAFAVFASDANDDYFKENARQIYFKFRRTLWIIALMLASIGIVLALINIIKNVNTLIYNIMSFKGFIALGILIYLIVSLLIKFKVFLHRKIDDINSKHDFNAIYNIVFVQNFLIVVLLFQMLASLK